MSIISIVIILALPAVSASIDSLSDLRVLVSSFDDPRMSAEDLAFYLASHGFDARPDEGFVQVDLGGHAYRLTPNGPAPGLASIAA